MFEESLFCFCDIEQIIIVFELLKSLLDLNWV